MLGFAAISETAISELPAPGLAVWTATASGTFSAVGISTNAAVFTATGTGTAAFGGFALTLGTLSAGGTVSPAFAGAATAASEFTAAGIAWVNFYGVSPTPESRTATVPLRPRSLALIREDREQDVPAVSRSATVIGMPRVVMAPRYPRAYGPT